MHLFLGCTFMIVFAGQIPPPPFLHYFCMGRKHFSVRSLGDECKFWRFPSPEQRLQKVRGECSLEELVWEGGNCKKLGQQETYNATLGL